VAGEEWVWPIVSTATGEPGSHRARNCWSAPRSGDPRRKISLLIPLCERCGSGPLSADRGFEWHRAVAPGREVGEITTHGLALSRPRRGFESRWGHQLVFVDSSANAYRPRPRARERFDSQLIG